MAIRYQVHPSIGVARIGNSPNSFYLAPETLGGLPTECDGNGNPTVEDGQPALVARFKDAQGCIRRQGAQFKIFAYDDANPNDPGREVTLKDGEIESIEWTVHLANKKAAWYRSSELDGDLMLGEQNSYQNRQVPWRNPQLLGEDKRQPLIIDPGPRTVNQPNQRVECVANNAPSGYPVSFPDAKLTPYPISTLGSVLMDRVGRLVVLGGFGNACGEEIIATFTGQNTWYDDVSDGPVYCQLRVKGQANPIQLTAWVLVVPPKFAPELRNITTLSDVMYDVGVRFMGLVPDLFDAKRTDWPGGWNPNYQANYERDVQSIIERPADYIWVANVPSMVAFAAPKFDVKDASEANRTNRQNYFGYFRQPGETELGPQHEVLMSPNGIPMMPLNAGTNPVSNGNIDKFMSLTLTEYMLLKQWADGKFTVGGGPNPPGIHPLDQASVGNCVGHPMSPGIEVSWNTRNPIIYETPYRLMHAHDEAYYQANGLDPSRDECTGGGCEPGDLTKRMSPPWQADFYQCTIEYINFTDPRRNLDFATGIPTPPTYYTYWWPPQAPMYVMSGAMTIEEQEAAGVVGGDQVYFLRGAPNISLLVECWKYMGFVLNQNTGPDRRDYPYFVEKERNHDQFMVASVAVAMPVNQLAASGSYLTEDNYFQPVWYLKPAPGNPGAARRVKG